MRKTEYSLPSISTSVTANLIISPTDTFMGMSSLLDAMRPGPTLTTCPVESLSQCWTPGFLFRGIDCDQYGISNNTLDNCSNVLP
jgi:hypothetical protein